MPLATNHAPGQAITAADINAIASQINSTTAINPLMAPFNAVGNSQTDDTNAVQAALDAAVTSGVYEVVLTKTHIVSGLVIPGGVELRATSGGKLWHKNGSTNSCVSMPNNGSVLRDIQIDGNANNQTTTTLIPVVVGGERNLVQNVYVQNAKHDGIVVSRGTNHKILSCTVINTGRYGITINHAIVDGVTVPTTHVVIGFNYVENSNNGALGIVGVAEYVTFVGNTTKDHGGDGIAAYNELNRRISCTGNVFHNPGNHGIHLGGQGLVMSDNVVLNAVAGHGFFAENHNNGATTGYNVSITGNVVERVQVGEGIRVGNMQNVTISGNSLLNVERYGILAYDSADVSITGNSIRTSILRQTVNGCGIRLNSTQRGTITGNTIRGINGDGILLDDNGLTGLISQFINLTGNTISSVVGWGLRSIGGCNRNLHGSNIYSTTTLGAISLVGANNVESGTNLFSP